MGIRERIHARADLAPLRAARDLDALAAALNAEGLRAPGERYVTMRTILGECPSGREIVMALRQAGDGDPVVAETLHFLRDDSGFDVGHPNTAIDIDRLVSAGVFSAEWRNELLGLAHQPVLVTRDQVNEAMFNPDGTEK